MQTPEVEIIISSCDKYSDLWEAGALFLNENWPDREWPTYLITDEVVSVTLPGVEILSAGKATEITERLAFVLERVRAQYVLLTLDDYFFIKPIRSEAIRDALAFMDSEKIDYLRLVPASAHYLRRNDAHENARYPGFYHRDLAKGDYIVQLTPGLWRVDFLRKTLTRRLNTWQYEVSLTNAARCHGANCALSNHNELPYLDVIRKGRVLRKANLYLKKGGSVCREENNSHSAKRCSFALKRFSDIGFPAGCSAACEKWAPNWA